MITRKRAKMINNSMNPSVPNVPQATSNTPCSMTPDISVNIPLNEAAGFSGEQTVKSSEKKAPSLPRYKKVMDAGEDDFKVIKHYPAYRDKSLLIKSIVERDKVILLSAPRRFGKTTNLLMIKYFFEKPEHNAVNNDNLELFKNLRINESTSVMSHFGKYPTIFLNFKNSSVHSFRSAFDLVSDIIREEYFRHGYLEHTEDEQLRKKTRLWFHEDAFRKLERENSTQLKRALMDLAYLLNKFHNQPVLVLIDEYDSFCNNIVLNSHDIIAENGDVISTAQQEVKKVIQLCADVFLGLLKTNSDVWKGILTGVSYISTMGLSGFNNLISFKFQETHDFSEFYGFTKTELTSLMAEFRPGNDVNAVISQFNGYRNDTLNTYSIVQYLNTGIIRKYWTDSGMIAKLSSALKIPAVRSIICKLMGNLSNSHTMTYYSRLSIDHIYQLIRIMDGNELNITQIDIYLNYILEQGYLKLTMCDAVNDICSVAIPNLEVKAEFKEQLKLFFENNYIADFSVVRECAKYIDELSSDDKDNAKLLLDLKNGLDRMFKTLKTPINNEATFHHLVFFIFLFTNKFECYSEARSGVEGTKRLDLMMLNETLGIIFELKFNQDTEIALNQIVNLSYHTAFKNKFYNPENIDVEYFLLIGLNLSKIPVEENTTALNKKYIFDISMSVLFNSLNLSDSVLI